MKGEEREGENENVNKLFPNTRSERDDDDDVHTSEDVCTSIGVMASFYFLDDDSSISVCHFHFHFQFRSFCP